MILQSPLSLSDALFNQRQEKLAELDEPPGHVAHCCHCGARLGAQNPEPYCWVCKDGGHRGVTARTTEQDAPERHDYG